jgi:phosphoglycerate kinase
MQLRRMQDADVRGKRVLVRVDFNVPLKDGADGKPAVADDTRIAAALPTLRWLLEQQAQVVLCSHLGRPKGTDDALRLRPVAAHLSELLGVDVQALPDCLGAEVQAAVEGGKPGSVMLLENLRFHKEEEANDPAFCQELAALAEVYINDAFGTAHRAHASTEGVAHLLPSYAGLLLQKEVEALAGVIHQPKRPLVVVMGGAKVSDKLEVLQSLIPLADRVLIGGAMANTFLKAQGFETGASLVEEEMLDSARELVALADSQGKLLLLPLDCVVCDDLKASQRIETKPAVSLAPDDIAVDIGPVTLSQYEDALSDARTVFWNGPMGVFEQEAFAQGTLGIAHALAELHGHAFTVIGGGESVEATNAAGVAGQISHISTGGGASLEFVGGRKLPGLAVLENPERGL